MVELLDYDPYGTERSSWSSMSDDGSADADKTYIGEYSDDETGLSYLNARYYDPARGQFLSQDPVFLRMGTNDQRVGVLLLDPQVQNSYAYGRNNPMTLQDKEGEFVFIPALITAAWAVFEAGFTAFDLVNAVETVADSGTSTAQKVMSVGGAFAGIAMPGGGYGKVGTEAVEFIGKQGDEVLKNVNPRSLLPTHTKSEITGNQVERLKTSMQNDGYKTEYPIDVWDVQGDLYIKNGHHRTLSAIQTGIKEIPARIEHMTDSSKASEIVSDWARTTGEKF
jgi:RHS repeat-associated protein